MTPAIAATFALAVACSSPGSRSSGPTSATPTSSTSHTKELPMMTDLGPNPSGICICGCGRTTPISPATIPYRGFVEGTHRPFAAQGCQVRYRTGFATYEDRFWARVDKSGGPDACWPWLGGKSTSGQGRFALERKMVGAHRYAYELTVGPVQPGLDLDHLCHTLDPTCDLRTKCPHRSCCNPAHLEPVTERENVLRSRSAPSAVNARKTHCIRGHEFVGANLVIDSRGDRQCRECNRMRNRRHRAKLAAAGTAAA